MKKKIVAGLEFSTQSAKVIVMDITKGECVFTAKVDYDTAFPAYHTQGGVLPHADSAIRQTDPGLLLDALDRVMALLSSAPFELQQLAALKVDAMQHATVYVNSGLAEKMSRLSSTGPLKSQLQECFSRGQVPIWEDSSTAQEVAWLNSRVNVKQLCGNEAELRFAAAQIMKWARQAPASYKETAHIFLLSSFYTTLLTGKITGVDTGDGWGTNLNNLNLENPGWDDNLLAAVDQFTDCADKLADKLTPMVEFDHVAGYMAPYFCQKYGLNPQTLVLSATGDNPATLVGCGGEAVVSLGSSFTVNGVLQSVDQGIEAACNVFGYAQNQALGLTCFTNGSKIHNEFIRRYVNPQATTVDQITPQDWQEFSRLAGPLGLNAEEKLMLPYLAAETVPPHQAGIVRQGFAESEAAPNIRALLVAQALGLRLYSAHLKKSNSLCLVGGAARNKIFRQFITDVFQTPTYMIEQAAWAAPLGCAVSCARQVLGVSYGEAWERLVKKEKSSLLYPQTPAKTINHLLERYQNFIENN